MASAIRLIINGYYRTGTTILARIIKLSNPDVLVLHEPTSVILCHELKNWKPGSVHALHGFDVYEDYYALGQDFIEELCRVWREYSFVNEPWMVIRIVDFINRYCLERGREVVLKLNQAFLCLPVLAEKFNTFVIHVYRDPAETLFDQIYPEHQKNTLAVEEALIGRNPSYFHIIGFWLDPLYEELARTLPLREIPPTDKIGRFLVTYLTLNTIAIRLCEETDRCVAVRFEEIIEKPHLFKKLVEKKTGLRISDEHLRLLDKSKAYKAPETIRRAVKNEIQILSLQEPKIPSLEELVKS